MFRSSICWGLITNSVALIFVLCRFPINLLIHTYLINSELHLWYSILGSDLEGINKSGDTSITHEWYGASWYTDKSEWFVAHGELFHDLKFLSTILPFTNAHATFDQVIYQSTALDLCSPDLQSKVIWRFRFQHWCGLWGRDITSSCVIWCHAFRWSSVSFWGLHLTFEHDVTFRCSHSSERLSKPP